MQLTGTKAMRWGALVAQDEISIEHSSSGYQTRIYRCRELCAHHWATVSTSLQWVRLGNEESGDKIILNKQQKTWLPFPILHLTKNLPFVKRWLHYLLVIRQTTNLQELSPQRINRIKWGILRRLDKLTNTGMSLMLFSKDKQMPFQNDILKWYPAKRVTRHDGKRRHPPSIISLIFQSHKTKLVQRVNELSELMASLGNQQLLDAPNMGLCINNAALNIRFFWI